MYSKNNNWRNASYIVVGLSPDTLDKTISLLACWSIGRNWSGTIQSGTDRCHTQSSRHMRSGKLFQISIFLAIKYVTLMWTYLAQPSRVLKLIFNQLLCFRYYFLDSYKSLTTLKRTMLLLALEEVTQQFWTLTWRPIFYSTVNDKGRNTISRIVRRNKASESWINYLKNKMLTWSQRQ